MKMNTLMEEYKKRFQIWSKKRSVRYFIPFILFVVGGSFGLREFTKLKFEYRSVLGFRDRISNSGIKLNDPEETTLEAVYEKVQEEDLDNWENKRIERPWEE